MESVIKKSSNHKRIFEFIQKIIITEEINFISLKGINTMLNFYSIENIENRFNKNGTLFYDLFWGKTFIGFAEFEKNHLVSLYIDKLYRSKNIGRKLLNYYIDKNTVYNSITVFSSPKSIAFYIKMGFEQESINCLDNYGILHMPMVKKLNII